MPVARPGGLSLQPRASGGAAETGGPPADAEGSAGQADAPADATQTGAAPPETSAGATGTEGQVTDETPAEPPRRRKEQAPRTWQINQRPVVGSEQAWGPPNGQPPAIVEISEPAPDPHQPPPTGIPRIGIGAVLGPVGLAVFGAGIAVATMDRYRDERRAAVPLIGLGLVTAAIGWGLFAHGILRRKAYMRWQAQRAAVLPAFGPRGGGVSLVLRF